MLIRILADNPGKTFTRNVDDKFIAAVQTLLRNGRDPSVKQILMETLDTFQRQKADDEGLAKLNEMWKAERERMIKIHVGFGRTALFNANLFRAQLELMLWLRLDSMGAPKTTFLGIIAVASFQTLMSSPPASKRPKPLPSSSPKPYNQPHHPSSSKMT